MRSKKVATRAGPLLFTPMTRMISLLPASSRPAPGVRLGSREHHAQVMALISSGGLLRAGLQLYGCCETPVRHHAAPFERDH